MLRLVFLCFLALFSNKSYSQQAYEQGYFRSPVDIDIILAGNFGELRNNHFHSGIDIKTQNKEGLSIFSVADGYVSRIKISPYGYGKALYITHPNGYVSVYAHLKGFNDTISAFVKAEQYKAESFAIDIQIPKDKIVVKKGEKVAISGNTGGSSGPHLHFEIREEKTEKAVNPLLWGFKTIDTQKPTTQEIGVYPMDIYSRINNKTTAQYFKIINNKVTIDTIRAFGRIGLGIQGYDTENLSSSKNGIYSIELMVNNKRIYFHEMEKFSFDETRYINCHIDYPAKIQQKKSVQRSFLLKNNRLSIYKEVVERGIININTDSLYRIKYIIKDVSGNTNYVNFVIAGTKDPGTIKKEKQESSGIVFHYADTNKFETADIKLKLPPNILYEDIQFTFKTNPTPTGNKFLTPAYKIHKETTPLHSTYSLSIKCPEMAEKYRDKAYIVLLNNQKRSHEGGAWENGYITTQTKYFGNFAIAIDTISPYIKPENIYNNKVITNQRIISFKIGDDQTGISEYRGTIDGKWVVFEYDAKSNRLFYEKQKLSKGKHKLTLEVKDGRKNTNIYNIDFIE